ncbi:RNA polymerase beta'' subunit family protein [Mangrovimonas spongiae]|uniref:TonB-dependent receptor plug domain-containing protein n=1 Tax=Mangrovimonas spongiae TaxID=2494697 RepID=A0A3R9M8V9_9FLAO|nr:hypothetical protein [Mangrovimonas spongiae]RSK39946.1 hypothetical protein EJA19_08675 [Mangrovimonas spongiae]
MHKKVSYFILFLTLITTSYSQNINIEDFDKKIKAYYALDYETIFTHLNKTLYLKNEELWFKTYIYDIKRQSPYISSTNIHSNIYNDRGELIKSKIYVAKNGFTNGNFKIDSTFSEGTYYIKTTTNWMKNFHQNLYDLQKFKVVGKKSTIPEETELETFDFQLLPEGGHLIENTLNTVGFKLINNNGKSIKITSGSINNSNNKPVATFKSNLFGLGKFSFTPKEGESYIASIELENGKTLTRPVTNIKKYGIGLSVENSRKDNLYIRLSLNQKTLKSVNNKRFFIAIHRDGFLNKIDVNFSDDKLTYQYRIGRQFLNKGVNIITLFNDEFKPIAERIIYNYTNSSVKNIEVSNILKKKDSTIITFSKKSHPKDISLSVSVLPSSTIANKTNKNIISKFLLLPYIKGNIENPWYYFNEIDAKKRFDLDLLLLTQGWSSYSWKNIFNTPPKLLHNFETGFLIKGKLNNYDYKNGDVLILQSKSNGIQLEYNLKDSPYFKFDKLYIKDKSNLSFTLKNKKGKLSTPNIYYNIYPSYKKDFINVKQHHKILKTKQLNDNKSFVLSEGINVLDSVIIKPIKISKPKNTPYGMSQAKHINFTDAPNQYSLITQQIRNYGFDVTNDGVNVKIINRRVLTFKGALSPIVFLDNVNITNSLEMISNLIVADVEEMFVSKISNINASPGGVIHIFTKRGFSRKKKSTYNNSTIDFGFSTPKKYYSPMYNTYKRDSFKSYGVLNWIPNVEKNTADKLEIKVPNYFYDSINLYIEGMGEDGSLFSQIETINVN